MLSFSYRWRSLFYQFYFIILQLMPCSVFSEFLDKITLHIINKNA